MASGFELIPITPQKHDPAWKHCQMFKNGDRVQLKCIYCGKLFKGGGIHRIKEHLACQKGNASTCSGVPTDVRALMQQSLDGVVAKKKNRQKLDEELTSINPQPLAEVCSFVPLGDVGNPLQAITGSDTLEPNSILVENQEEVTPSGRNMNRRKRGRSSTSSAHDAAVNVLSNGALGFKKVNSHVDMAIGQFLYDIGAPLDAANSAYFQPMVDAIASAGSGIVPPSCHDLCGWILKNSVEEVKNDIDKYRMTWERTGCSILVDRMDTVMGRVFLNFLVQCPEGIIFLESMDASDMINSSNALYEQLKRKVEEVGERHVLQVITSSEEEYIVAGRRLTETFPSLYWVPCAARCIDLILQDFGTIEWINVVIEQARSVTRFVYNHSMVLNMVRRYTSSYDIVEPGVTRTVTNFKTLKRLVDVKDKLHEMVTSKEWMISTYSKCPGGLEMLDVISNRSFWSSCVLINHLTDPILRALRIVGSKKRPAMGYVYAAMYRAKEAIKKALRKRDDYMIYWNIINHRWERNWHLPLHAAGFYFNPKFFYSIEGDIPNNIHSGVFDCIERLIPDTKIQDKIIKEIHSYKNAAGDFGRKMAIRTRDTLLPAEWWSTYGGGCPNLARLAVRILSQTCSSIGCQRSQIPFEKIHDTRNYLEQQRLSDLVFVQCNLKLRQMGSKNGQDSIDSLSFDTIGVLEDWVRGKDIILEDRGVSNWMALDPPSANVMLLGPTSDDDEDLGAGFDDYEIFVMDKEDNTEDTI